VNVQSGSTPASPPAPPRPGPLPGPLGRVAAKLYSAAIARRNRAFDTGHHVERLSVPVVSIGNVSVGGTGKSPLVAHVCRLVLEAGVRPCIAMRGYARGGARSDEADSYEREFGDAVDIVARADRLAGIRPLLAGTSRAPGVVVLDDGFQHRRIARNLDIVLIDVSRDPFADRLLPAGWLREPADSLQRASCVVLTHAELAPAGELDSISLNVQRVHGRSPLATTRHLWTALRDASDKPFPLDYLMGRRIIGVCAIGNPAGFVEALRLTAGDAPSSPPHEVIALPDHDPFRPATVRRIAETARRARAQAIVVTDKDWSKLRLLPSSTWPCAVLRPTLSLGFVNGRQAFDEAVLASLRPASGR